MSAYGLRSRIASPMETPPPKGPRWDFETPERRNQMDESIPHEEFESESDFQENQEDGDRFVDEEVQFLQKEQRQYGKKLHSMTVGGFRMVLEFLNYTWFLLPFICLLGALLLPRYLIAAIQATPTTITTSGQSHYNSMSSIQLHMDSVIKDIEFFKKFQKEQESRMEEVIFLYEQTTKNIETLLGRSTGDLPPGVLDHVAEMIQVSLKKSIRELKSEYKTALQPLETGLRQVSTHASLLENDMKTYKTQIQDVEELVEQNKKQILEYVENAGVLEVSEHQISSIVANEMVQLNQKLSRTIADETSRLEQSQAHSIQQLQNATQNLINSVIDSTSISIDGTVPALNKRIDFAAVSSGASIAHYKSDFVDRKFNTVFQNLFTASTLTSKSFNTFPLCSIMGSTCPLVNRNPETAITANVDVGNCWSFTGSKGKLSVKFAYPIVADSVEIFHLDPTIAPDFSSAPRDIQVIGLTVDSKKNELVESVLGEFTYEKHGPPSQTFHLASTSKIIDGMTLRVISNYGNEKYTCLYRFGVHGSRSIE